MDLPLGYQYNVVASQGERLVCLLHKSIYSLKQALCQWFDKFSDALLLLGFKQTKSDYSLFIQGSGASFVALLVYVDDIIVTSASSSLIDSLKVHLNNVFKLKDLGPLGLELTRSSTRIFLSQRHYALQLIEDTGFLATKPCPLPMDPNIKLSASDGKLLDDPSVYRRLIGRLLYLTISRPDITFTVHKLSQFMAAPHTTHLAAVHSLIRYLKGCPGQEILLNPTKSFQLRAFADADWGSCFDSRKSTTGFCIFLGDSLVSWKAKKQSTIFRSSTEAEYRALAATVSEIVWISHLLTALQILVPLRLFYFVIIKLQFILLLTLLYIFHEQTKHIKLDCHFVRDKVLDDMVKLLPIRTDMQIFLQTLFFVNLYTCFYPRWVLLIPYSHLEGEYYS